jgi:outer membrane biosynthesis protein TonB
MSRRLPAAAVALALAVVFSSASSAADPAFDKTLRDSLAQVHNKGADLYNQSKDYAGAYRVYEGALLTAKPLLGHRAATQKAIDDGLAAAAKEADAARKAFLLHETIERVRADLKEAAAEVKKSPEVKKTEDPKKTEEPMKSPDVKKAEEPTKTPEVKKTEEPKTAPAPKPVDDPKKANPPPAAPGKGVRGVVTYMGKPVPAADLTFVTLDLPAPKVVAATTNADGSYAADLPQGRYRVTVAATANGKALLPARYATTDTSGLTVTVAAGGNTFDIRLE